MEESAVGTAEIGFQKDSATEKEIEKAKRRRLNFKDGPVRDEHLGCWRWDGRNPDKRRIKKRWLRKREAERWWRHYLQSIEDGTWNQEAMPKTVGDAFDAYRISAKL